MSKVLLNGLYDPNCLLSMLRGVRTEVIGEIVWKEMLAWNWKIFPEEKTVGSARATSDFSLSHELLGQVLRSRDEFLASVLPENWENLN